MFKDSGYRISFFEFAGKPTAKRLNTTDEFLALVESIKNSNSFRNTVIHNRFVGIRFSTNPSGGIDVSAMKSKYSKKPENRSYDVSRLLAVSSG